MTCFLLDVVDNLASFCGSRVNIEYQTRQVRLGRSAHALAEAFLLLYRLSLLSMRKPPGTRLIFKYQVMVPPSSLYPPRGRLGRWDYIFSLTESSKSLVYLFIREILITKLPPDVKSPNHSVKLLMQSLVNDIAL